MRSFAVEEPGSPVPALYATLDNTHILDGEGQELHAHPAQVRARHLFYHHCKLVHVPI